MITTGPEYTEMDESINSEQNNQLHTSREGIDVHRVEVVGVHPVKRIVGFEVTLRRVQSEQKMSSRSNESPTSVFEDMESTLSQQEEEVQLSTLGELPARQVCPAKSHLAEALKRSHSMPFNSNTADMDESTMDDAQAMTRHLPKLRIQHSRRAFS